MSDAVGAVAVVVPARDEQRALPDCLAAVAAACRLSPVAALVVVVADHCTDATAEIAHASGTLVTGRTGDAAAGVGAARAVGCAHAMAHLSTLPARRIWLACTDADTVVPADWLLAQVAVAESGADAVVGRVALAPGQGPADTAAPHHTRWHEAYESTRSTPDRHRNVHGANLGVRADAYLSVGGFAPVPAHEDVGLVTRLLAGGHRVRWCDRPRVVTSARLDARAPVGVSSDLRALL